MGSQCNVWSAELTWSRGDKPRMSRVNIRLRFTLETTLSLTRECLPWVWRKYWFAFYQTSTTSGSNTNFSEFLFHPRSYFVRYINEILTLMNQHENKHVNKVHRMFNSQLKTHRLELSLCAQCSESDTCNRSVAQTQIWVLYVSIKQQDSDFLCGSHVCNRSLNSQIFMKFGTGVQQSAPVGYRYFSGA